jgi:transcription elongation GreA/GreB family factor
MKKQLELKKKLFLFCEDYVNQKINAAQEAIDNAQKSANQETKSSAGDKYETGRSMLQLDIEKYSAQLHEGMKLKKTLNQIDYKEIYQNVQTGSLVETNHGNFFLSISAGKITLGVIEYMAISFSSPIGQALFNKKVNDEINFRGDKFLIESVF